MNWNDLTEDTRLQQLLYALMEAEFDSVSTEEAVEELVEYLEDSIEYCAAEQLGGEDCPRYQAPDGGDFCIEHKVING